MLATAAICCSMATTAFAAPGKFNVKADELEYDLQTGKGLGKGNVVILQDDGKATANYANFDSKAKTGLLIGKVVVTKGDTQINCETFSNYNFANQYTGFSLTIKVSIICSRFAIVLHNNHITFA